MKKFENSLQVTGFVGRDAEIRTFTSASVARFSLAVSRTEKNGDDTVRTSAFMAFEAWRKNENLADFVILRKGQLITVEGFMKPEEWTDDNGDKHSRIVFVATKVYPAAEQDTDAANEAPAKTKTTKKGK